MSRWVFAVSLIASGCVELVQDPIEDGEGRPEGHENEPDGVGTGSGTGSGSGSGGGGTGTACSGEVAEGRCFTLSSEPATWTDAKARCAARGERLAKVDSMPVHEAVMNQLTLGASVYLGASDQEQPGAFKWVDGTPLAGFVMWQPFEPTTGSTEHCLAALDAGFTIGWTNETCSDARPYVCERRL